MGYASPIVMVCNVRNNKMDVAITKPSNNNNARNYEYIDSIYLFFC